MAAAQDTGGIAAAGPFYDRASVSYTALIDTRHTVTSLYGMVNVPTGVWIDEKGMIVRPPEVAYSEQKTFGTLVVGSDRYVLALKDWVAHGSQSAYVFAPDELAEHLRPHNPERSEADAHFKLAVYLHELGAKPAANAHWRAAQELDPENWNYHRQQWSFEPETAGKNWLLKFRALGNKPYYQPADLKPRKPAKR